MGRRRWGRGMGGSRGVVGGWEAGGQSRGMRRRRAGQGHGRKEGRQVDGRKKIEIKKIFFQ